MEAVDFPTRFVTTSQTIAWHHNPEGDNLSLHYHKNFKSHIGSLKIRLTFNCMQDVSKMLAHIQELPTPKQGKFLICIQQFLRYNLKHVELNPLHFYLW
jgi:hypothetical protein